MFTDRIHQFSQKHQLFHERSTILVGVSGGPDSLALLHYLKSIQKAWKFQIKVVTIDHMLRGKGSSEDVHYVQQLCEQWGVECYSVSLDVPTYKKQHKLGTQAAARALRYEYFEMQMENLNADFLALGHHGDDQVETIFMRLMRGVEPANLKGIPVKRSFGSGYIIRPFLCVTKEDIEHYCQSVGVNPRRDPSNSDPIYTRNAFRLNVLPFLKEFNPKINQHMQVFHEYLSEDEMFLKQQAQEVFQSAIFEKNTRSIQFNRKEFQSLASPLQRRAFHLILNYLYFDPPSQVTYDHWEKFTLMITEEGSKNRLAFPDGLAVIRSYDRISFTFEQSSPPSFDYVLDVPGEINLPNGAKIHSTVYTNQEEWGSFHFVCDISNVSLPLQVRTRQPGDKMRVRGLQGHKKIKKLFIDEKIPHQQRDEWPIVVDQQGQVLWVVGLRKAELQPTHNVTSWLHLTYNNTDHF